MANPAVLCRLVRLPSTEAPFLHRHYPASTVLRASPPPQTAQPDSHELLVDPLRPPLGLPVLRLLPVACMPSPLPRQDRCDLFARAVPSASAFPVTQAGRLLHYPFRGLLSVHSRYGLHARRIAIATLSTGGFSGFVTSTTAPVATGRNEPVPGRDLHPLWTNAFSRRTEKCGLAGKEIISVLDDRGGGETTPRSLICGGEYS